jgi:hypothetical protein
MEKKSDPFRPVYFVVTIIVALACLVGLYFQDPNGVLEKLSGVGMCLGVVLLVLVIGAIYGVANEQISNPLARLYPNETRETV